jgi:hypothetical protein
MSLLLSAAKEFFTISASLMSNNSESAFLSLLLTVLPSAGLSSLVSLLHANRQVEMKNPRRLFLVMVWLSL